MKNSLLLFLIFFLLRPCNAISRDFTFSNINESFGISMREITAAVRDDDGFIWAASRSGVLRVASDDYRLYQLPFATTDVLQLKMASRGSLLVVATQNGQVFRYNRILNKFEQWYTLSSLLGNDNWVTNLLIDVDGKVWISTSIGIFFWTGKEVITNRLILGNQQRLLILGISIYNKNVKKIIICYRSEVRYRYYKCLENN